MNSESRNKRVELKLNDTEYFLLSEKAERSRMNHSELLRNLIYFGTTSQRTNFSADDANNIISELSLISSSMEQIAYNSKINCGVSQDDFDSLADNFKDLVIKFDNFVRG